LACKRASRDFPENPSSGDDGQTLAPHELLKPTPRLLVCSHRGPVSHRRVNGRLVMDAAGPGGLVPVLTPIFEHFGGRWLFAAMTDGDRELANTSLRPRQHGAELHLLDLPSEIHRQHYQVASVGYLGLLFHYLFHPPYAPLFDRAFFKAWESYRQVNDLYAQKALTLVERDLVWVQDYHLMLAAARMQAHQKPARQTPTIYFHHVSWCEPDYFGILPSSVGKEILQGLLAHQVVAFHSRRWAQAFLRCCEQFLSGISCTEDAILWRDRSVRVVSSPAALDFEHVAALARDPRTESWVEQLSQLRAGRWALVRVDRADLWKNLLRGFSAFEVLLERRPSLAHEVWFLALVSPTRMWVPEYRQYLERCKAVVERINERFTSDPSSRPPVTLLIDQNPASSGRHRALAGLRIADALLVNPIFDGLNLVAKEGVAVSEGQPVLVLSRNAGVYEELGHAAISINPFDIDETATAIERAFDMPSTERARRATELRRLVLSRRPEDWGADQLQHAYAEPM
jgi:trehalose 6-phosphate synthase